MSSITGKTLRHYEIGELIGSGGMGEVYRATDTVLDREVAIKVLSPDLLENAQLLARFDREARLLAALNHPNIATIYGLERDSGEDSGRFLVLELVEGRSLLERLEDGPLGIDETLSVAGQTASALEAAHKKAIVHRDLKPANIMVTLQGMTKILDFGVAKPLAVTDSSETAAALTEIGSVLGTVSYMSPEQLRGEDVDQRSDIWSFGCVTFEMLTGKKVFPEDSLTSAVAAILQRAPDWSLLPDDTPEGLRRLLERCLRRDRGARLSSMADARRLLEGEDVQVEATVPTGPSIAVLPFRNLSTDPENEYFCEGLSEELINGLTQLPGMKVASRTSAFRFRARELDVREIGKKLGVGSVLEGSVRRSGKRLRVNVQLVGAADGYQIWSERYDGDVEDIFAVQDEMTESIVRALEPRLLSGKRELVRRPTDNLEAYESYMKGRHFWHRRTEKGLKLGIECFERAIHYDPEFALAWAGVADSYSILRVYFYISASDGKELCRRAAQRALDLDPSLAEAHFAQALYRFYYEDWKTAEPLFRKAIEIHPRSSLLQAYYGVFLALDRRFEQAVLQTEIALELDPLSSLVHALAGINFFMARQPQAAVKASERALDLESDNALAWWALGVSLSTLEEHDAAVRAMEKVVDLSQRAPIFLGLMGFVCARAGQQGRARELIGELAGLHNEGRYVSPASTLFIFAGLQDWDAFGRQLPKCVDDKTAPLSIVALIGPFIDHRFDEPGTRELLIELQLTPPREGESSAAV